MSKNKIFLNSICALILFSSNLGYAALESNVAFTDYKNLKQSGLFYDALKIDARDDFCLAYVYGECLDKITLKQLDLLNAEKYELLYDKYHNNIDTDLKKLIFIITLSNTSHYEEDYRKNELYLDIDNEYIKKIASFYIYKKLDSSILNDLLSFNGANIANLKLKMASDKFYLSDFNFSETYKNAEVYFFYMSKTIESLNEDDIKLANTYFSKISIDSLPLHEKENYLLVWKLLEVISYNIYNEERWLWNTNSLENMIDEYFNLTQFTKLEDIYSQMSFYKYENKYRKSERVHAIRTRVDELLTRYDIIKLNYIDLCEALYDKSIHVNCDVNKYDKDIEDIKKTRASLINLEGDRADKNIFELKKIIADKINELRKEVINNKILSFEVYLNKSNYKFDKNKFISMLNIITKDGGEAASYNILIDGLWKEYNRIDGSNSIYIKDIKRISNKLLSKINFDQLNVNEHVKLVIMSNNKEYYERNRSYFELSLLNIDELKQLIRTSYSFRYFENVKEIFNFLPLEDENLFKERAIYASALYYLNETDMSINEYQLIFDEINKVENEELYHWLVKSMLITYLSDGRYEDFKKWVKLNGSVEALDIVITEFESHNKYPLILSELYILRSELSDNYEEKLNYFLKSSEYEDINNIKTLASIDKYFRKLFNVVREINTNNDNDDILIKLKISTVKRISDELTSYLEFRVNDTSDLVGLSELMNTAIQFENDYLKSTSKDNRLLQFVLETKDDNDIADLNNIWNLYMLSEGDEREYWLNVYINENQAHLSEIDFFDFLNKLILKLDVEGTKLVSNIILENKLNKIKNCNDSQTNDIIKLIKTNSRDMHLNKAIIYSDKCYELKSYSESIKIFDFILNDKDYYDNEIIIDTSDEKSRRLIRNINIGHIEVSRYEDLIYAYETSVTIDMKIAIANEISELIYETKEYYKLIDFLYKHAEVLNLNHKHVLLSDTLNTIVSIVDNHRNAFLGKHDVIKYNLTYLNKYYKNVLKSFSISLSDIKLDLKIEKLSSLISENVNDDQLLLIFLSEKSNLLKRDGDIFNNNQNQIESIYKRRKEIKNVGDSINLYLERRYLTNDILQDVIYFTNSIPDKLEINKLKSMMIKVKEINAKALMVLEKVDNLRKIEILYYRGIMFREVSEALSSDEYKSDTHTYGMIEKIKEQMNITSSNSFDQITNLVQYGFFHPDFTIEALKFKKTIDKYGLLINKDNSLDEG